MPFPLHGIQPWSHVKWEHLSINQPCRTLSSENAVVTSAHWCDSLPDRIFNGRGKRSDRQSSRVSQTCWNELRQRQSVKYDFTFMLIGPFDSHSCRVDKSSSERLAPRRKEILVDRMKMIPQFGRGFVVTLVSKGLKGCKHTTLQQSPLSPFTMCALLSRDNIFTQWSLILIWKHNSLFNNRLNLLKLSAQHKS